MKKLSTLCLVSLFALACGDGGAGGPDAAPPVDAAPPPADAAPPPADAAPPPPGFTLLDDDLAVDLTPDGRTAVFERLTPFDATLVFYDTVTGVATDKGSIGDPSRDLATGVSADGKVTAMHGDPVQAGLFAGGAWMDLGSTLPAGCDQDIGAAWDISADGSVVVGMLWDGCSPIAFRWSAGAFTLLQVLGTPPDGATRGPSNRATVVSDDGTVVAGFAENGPLDRTPAMWRADGTGELLDPTQTDTPGEVLSISADGRTLAGISGYDGFVWTRGTGLVRMVRFDLALPSDPVYPNAMTADGSFIYGAVGDAFFSVPTAFVWSGPGGMVPLAEVAAAAGVAIPDGVLLNNVLAASADGAVLIGTATDAQGASKSFVLRLR